MTVADPLLLTSEQQEAVGAEQARVLLVASAGSGKTEVLIRRVIRILSESAGESFRVLAVTYTVRAAEEVRRRIQATVGDEAWRVDAETVHGFALKWLHRYGQGVGIDASTLVYSDDVDRAELLGEYLRSIGVTHPIEEDLAGALRPILADIDRLRTYRPRDAMPEVGESYFGVPLRELKAAYLEALEQAGAIDYPGMLTKLIQAMDEDPWIVKQFRTTYRHVLIDEGQDLSPVHVDLFDGLIGSTVDLFVVADDRQSINGFAGGAFSNARALVGDAQHSPLHLPHNFRCATSIIDAAEAVAAHLDATKGRVFSAENAPPGEIRFVEAEDREKETVLVADWVDGLLEDGLPVDVLSPGEDPSVAPEQVGVIGRTRWVVQEMAEELRGRGIECVLQAEPGALFATPEARLLVDLLALAVNVDDRPARRRAGDEIRETLGGEAEEEIFDWLETQEYEPFRVITEIAASAVEGQDLGVLLSEKAAGFETAEWDLDLPLLQRAWSEYAAGTRVQTRNISGFLQHVSKLERTRPTDPGVRALTIHRVKGLEFKAVALVDARDGMIPHYRSKSDEEINEERRSFYVAMTRASRSLHISWPRTTTDRYRRTHRQEPSRFLAEAQLI